MTRVLVCIALLLAAGQAATAAPLFAGKRVGDQALAAQRGGTDTGSQASLQAVVSNNQAVNVTTGGNTVAGGALAGAAGVPVVVQNSGNNVVVQSSTIINVTLK